MSLGFEAIADELRRLRRSGVDRVFVAEDSLELLRLRQSDSGASDQERSPLAREESRKPHLDGQSADHSDLRSLIKGASPSSTPAPEPETAVDSSLPEAPEIVVPDTAPAEQLEWLHKRLLDCEVSKGELNEGARLVFGAGSPSADIFFCGEAPGADEERTGEPFVGKAGQLLTKIIAAMGLSRDSVYIANILKWRPRHDKPYGNRPPTEDEMRFCLPYLKAQIDIVQPDVIVALGNTAVIGLLGPDPHRKMSSARGTWAEFNGAPLMITFHPSYLLRNGTLKTKRLVWEDMLKVLEKCNHPISEKQRGYFLEKS